MNKKSKDLVAKVVIAICIVIFILACIIVFVFYSPSGNGDSSNEENRIYSLNEPIYCDNGSVSVTVTNKATQNHSTYADVNEGDELIAIYVTVKNGKNSDYDFSEDSFQLINGNGEVIKPLYGTIREMWEGERLKNTRLASGGEKSGYIVFKNNIANDTKASLRFNCDSSWLTSTDDYKTINLQ